MFKKIIKLKLELRNKFSSNKLKIPEFLTGGSHTDMVSSQR